MTRIVLIIIIALTFLMLFQVLTVTGQEEQEQKEWTGMLRDGKILTKNELNDIRRVFKKLRHGGAEYTVSHVLQPVNLHTPLHDML